jgi:hypothetical protein
MSEGAFPNVVDRVTTRSWETDLSLAGNIYRRKIRPANRRRQKIVRFIDRDGEIERFEILQTLPYCGYEEPCPPSQAQYTAVSAFFMEGCETSFQAKTLLCARDYAHAVAKSFPFTGHRQEFLWFCIAAFILSDKDLRSRVTSWAIKTSFYVIETGISNHKPYKHIHLFASKLIDDMRGSGSEIFG